MVELLCNMRERMDKKGQQTMGMPFGMIFAIFLIVVFIVIAFIAVKGFLDVGESSEVGIFYRDLQYAVDEALSEQYGESPFPINLPSKIKKVCFANLSSEITNDGVDYKLIKDYEIYNSNVFLVPPEYAKGMQYKLIEGINISRITNEANPYCVDVKDGLKINKEFYGNLVWVE